MRGGFLFVQRSSAVEQSAPSGPPNRRRGSSPHRVFSERDLGRHDSIDRYNPSSYWAVSRIRATSYRSRGLAEDSSYDGRRSPAADVRGLTTSDCSVVDCRPRVEGNPHACLIPEEEREYRHQR